MANKVTIMRMDELKKICEQPEDNNVIDQPVRVLTEEEKAEIESKYDIGQSDNKSGRGMGWYVVHTYSGYENNVMRNITKAIENRNLQDKILKVEVPTQDVIETTPTNKKKVVQRKLFPGYVLIEMDADDNVAWYVVRNTRGVTGFVGPGSKPVPLTYDEVIRTLTGEKKVTKVDFEVGDTVVILSGTWEGRSATVDRIDEGKEMVTLSIDFFNQKTHLEISFAEVKKMQ